jgi:hypothetical protein
MTNFNITIENHIIANNVLTLGTVDSSLQSSLLSEMMRQSSDDNHQFTPNDSPLLTSTLDELTALVNDVKNRGISPDLVDTFTVNSVEFTDVPEGSHYESDTCQNAIEDTWTAIVFLTTDETVHGIILHDYSIPNELDSHRPIPGSFIIIPGQTRYQHVFNNTENGIAYLTVRFRSSIDFSPSNVPTDSIEIEAFINDLLKDM